MRSLSFNVFVMYQCTRLNHIRERIAMYVVVYWEMRGRKRKRSERKSSAEKDCRMSSIKINVSGTVCSSVLRDYISLLG